ncbi:DUF7553 family protein [Natrinema salifodinae]|uniref:Uncharacterized protein n=1 Tax=Natrinema salifodinae TaxID=1202768 RepID=A0A1I0PKI7_9EURY|nr:hypothetical protein [Natrinema salifodinae]SEW14947.1 hypothetical protein SAMN05216285_2674 [Natrinema salifodinae]
MADETSDRERDHDPDDHLKRVREGLQQATDTADRTVESQLNSITAGVFEEQEGHLTQPDPGPKRDRIAEVAEKLDGLADQATGETRDHILTAREHCRAYLAEGGGDEQPRNESE